MEKVDSIYVFYHLFLVDRWRHIWNYHVQTVIESELYDSCKEVKVGVIYKNAEELKEFEDIIKKYPKVSILYSRSYSSLPVTIWNEPKKTITAQLGEGESILKMIEYAKKIEGNQFSCLFFHSKGVTRPNNEKRSQISHFYARGLAESADAGETQRFILQDMTEETVAKWREKLALLKRHSFYYYIWNFFWISGKMLQAFDFKAFNKRGEFPTKYKFKDRHHTAIFPINLYQVQHKKKLGDIRKLIGFYE
ncbi:hypothetical protein [Tunicatimonas pelagia]|uniref:hypothetical protein n=1 Tax=Tunicatimonas pelagia TaxID=931531 RepID=UPI0026656BC4|nr:hypothetical protein [Tunicatimonas pelagia]WKN41967.1 hypothetical protein P0M28_23275 [Tunicatimonas pelagia]